jgi:hypothetical protein
MINVFICQFKYTRNNNWKWISIQCLTSM